MFIEVIQQRELCIIRFKGRIASGVDPDYLGRKLDEIRRIEPFNVLADLREVASIGSMGLGFLVRVFEVVTNRPSGRFVAAGLNPRVREAFRVTRLDEVIPIASDLDAGTALLAGSLVSAGPR
ncbi:MAG TPA: STAS domain-containing protein [Bryobacteraceae bacterium]|jgi:anti-anti-sigma factor